MTIIQDRFIECTANRAIFVGARQSGKTTTLFKKAKQLDKNGNRIAMLAPSSGMRSLLEGKFKSRLSLTTRFITEQQLLGTNVDALFVDEINYFDSEVRQRIMQSTPRIYATMTPRTDNSLSKYDSFKKFYNSAQQLYGHRIVVSHSGGYEQLLCVDCGMETTQKTHSPIEMMYNRGMFITNSCDI
jgi:thymidine kinase